MPVATVFVVCGALWRAMFGMTGGRISDTVRLSNHMRSVIEVLSSEVLSAAGDGWDGVGFARRGVAMCGLDNRIKLAINDEYMRFRASVEGSEGGWRGRRLTVGRGRRASSLGLDARDAEAVLRGVSLSLIQVLYSLVIGKLRFLSCDVGKYGNRPSRLRTTHSAGKSIVSFGTPLRYPRGQLCAGRRRTSIFIDPKHRKGKQQWQSRTTT